MEYLHNKNLKSNSQNLRKNMTKEERRLWYEFLKTLPVTFNRQKIINNYIVDFYCATSKLIIELDGSQHYEEEKAIADKERDLTLNKLGFGVLRFTNRDINERFNFVCEEIYRYLNLE